MPPGRPGLHKIVTPPPPFALTIWLLGANALLSRALAARATPKGPNLSTESIATESDLPREELADSGRDAARQPGLRCPSCRALHAADQRYCLECGERLAPASSVLTGGAPFGAGAPTGAGGTPPTPPPELMTSAGREPLWQRNGALTLLAGVGVLLLAMGDGVLIGRAGDSKQVAGSPSVITVAGSGGTASTGATEATFTGDWPAGTKGYTVELQTVPTTSTVSAVEAAKSAATAKGAKSVGALNSDEYASLPAGSYVIYSGVYHTRAAAQKALPGLKKSFPAAKVVEVSSGGGSSSSSKSSEPEVKQPGGTGESFNKPAPPSVLEGLKKAKGKSYEEKSKNLPNVIGT